MANGFTVKDAYPEHGNISTAYCGLVEVDKSVSDSIVQTSVYNLEYLSKVIATLTEHYGTASRIQMRFAESPDGEYYLLLLKVWNEATNKMYPEESNRYIVLAPVIGGIKKKGFAVWSERKPVIETVIVDRTPVSVICPNHVSMVNEEELLAKLEGGSSI